MDKSYTVEGLTLPDGLVLTPPQCTVYTHVCCGGSCTWSDEIAEIYPEKQIPQKFQLNKISIALKN